MALEGESSGAAATAHNLADTPVTPSARPTVVVVDRTHYDDDVGDQQDQHLNYEQDLWLSTVDGRYSSSPIPVRVGSLHNMQTFHVHKDVLIKAQWFQKALCGSFREADEQLIDLPEEDPAIFHFLVAYLYEGRFDPVKSAASALDPPLDKGKGVDDTVPETPDGSDSSSSSSSSESSNNSDTSGALRRNHRRRARGIIGHSNSQDRPKQPGVHRPDCGCPQCLMRQDSTRCWQCGARRLRPNPHQQQQPAGRVPIPPGMRAIPSRGHIINVAPPVLESDHVRIKGEDFRTWLLTYELNLDVYICANRYLMDDFRKAVMRSCIDMLEMAGTDAAHPQVLQLCRKLYAGVPETDPLLKMVLARIGFLQPTLWKRSPEETGAFLVENPEISAAILRETVMRHQAVSAAPALPSMEGA